MSYTPTHERPHPGCHVAHPIQHVLGMFIVIRLLTPGWDTVALFAVVGTLVAVRMAQPLPPCPHGDALVRRGWAVAAYFADTAQIGVQCSVASRLLPHPQMLGVATANWVTFTLFLVSLGLETPIFLLHRRATYHPKPETEPDSDQETV